MQGINKVFLSGRLTNNFEIKGKATMGGIAVNGYNNTTDFFDLVAFGKTAEYCVKYLKKGQTVIVEGSLSVNKYNDKKYYQVVIANISSLGGGKDDNEKKSHEEANGEDANLDGLVIPDDDTPF